MLEKFVFVNIAVGVRKGGCFLPLGINPGKSEIIRELNLWI